MVSKDNMAQAYVDQLRSNFEQAKANADALAQHLKECEEALADSSGDAD